MSCSLNEVWPRQSFWLGGASMLVPSCGFVIQWRSSYHLFLQIRREKRKCRPTSYNQKLERKEKIRECESTFWNVPLAQKRWMLISLTFHCLKISQKFRPKCALVPTSTETVYYGSGSMTLVGNCPSLPDQSNTSMKALLLASPVLFNKCLGKGFDNYICSG